MTSFRSSAVAMHPKGKAEPVVAFDWGYWMCSLETEADRFGPFADLVALWRSRIRDNGRLPRRSDFRAEEFAGWMGRIFIAKIEHDPFDLRFTLWGSTLSEWWRVDYTGQTLGTQSSDPEAWAVERRYFEEMARRPFFGLAGGSLSEYGRSHIKVVGLDLPFSNGTGLDQILSAHMRIDAEQALPQLLPDCPLSAFEENNNLKAGPRVVW
ncbi:hypothetical protein [Nisaea sp.]|uniref:hypothetical protein n=1 Tax=Nisaea sp. TaxID=2024842 RepID=UPI003B51A331